MYEIEFYDYCAEHIDKFEERAQAARAVMDSRRCSLSAADSSLFAEVCRAMDDFCAETGIDADEIDEII